MDPRHCLNLISGAWLAAEGERASPNVNPADSGDVIGLFADSSADDARAAVAAAAAARACWHETGPAARGALLFRAAELLAERAGEFAGAIVREQGKRPLEARAEVVRSGEVLRFLAGEGRRLTGVTAPADDARTLAYTFRVPIGVVGLITPWNFPLAIPMWKSAAALVAGCTAVLKPSPLAPWTAALMVQLFLDAGVPPGVLNLVQGGREPAEAIVAHRDVAGVSFTGSVPVGVAIHEAAAPRLLRTQLELGGNNAVLVLPGADLDAAVSAVLSGAFGQAGQRCSATSRVIVDTGLAAAFLPALAARVSALRVGRGDDPDVDMGPVITAEARRRCLDAIGDARARGARIWCGDEPLPGGLPDGNFLRPTVLSDVPPDSELVTGEVFGPVVSVLVAESLDDAISIANSVPYGMSAAVFTRETALALDAVQRLQAGMLHVNRPTVGAYAHLPHMGTKMSQFGPPECSPEAMDFFTELRSVCVRY
ncbi:aldehyde dehydrogenase [Micromonospora sp. C95]|uniref:aldehyde dehydrogenase family protein n=1 Tax=Micromonospora sp. C95 TaxID=2824882 RepID=UPI001B39042F|nr:aldehyde dehydrogenase family protein [Micromonospora sp. C95]MBQ1023945.1 aldehyde dehydrogenase [Micromonospora sp. C95]